MGQRPLGAPAARLRRDGEKGQQGSGGGSSWQAAVRCWLHPCVLASQGLWGHWPGQQGPSPLTFASARAKVQLLPGEELPATPGT